VNENGTLKLNRSWKVKSFTKGLELFQLVGNVAETEGMYLLLVAFTVTDI
jgi:4a-hydroxytetrahydrobiopterin dehydratase